MVLHVDATGTAPGDPAWAEGPDGYGHGGTKFGVARTDWSANRISMRRSFDLASVPGELDPSLFNT